MDDASIMELVRQGQLEKAFGQIVSAYSERLYWHVRSMSVSHEDTDDLLQEVFIKIWQSLQSFRGESRLFTWIYRIATNEVLNFLKRQKLRSVLSLDALSESGATFGGSSDPFFDGDHAEALVCRAVEKLPPRQRAVFVLRYYDEMKYEDISAILKTSVGSLKATYHIAAEKVRREVEKK